MKKKYTLDEIIDKKFARLLLREDESVELNLKLSELPRGIKEGDIVELKFIKDKIVFAEIKEEETKKARQEIKNLIEGLKKKGSRDLKW